MGLKIDELRSFVAVAATGSFSEAARKIRRAQSVVSMHISGMEAELGYKLFDRTPKPVLTPRGTELLVVLKPAPCHLPIRHPLLFTWALILSWKLRS